MQQYNTCTDNMFTAISRYPYSSFPTGSSFQGTLLNTISSQLSARLMVILRRMELHCARGNTNHTSFSVIKAGSWYNWWVGAIIVILLRDGLGPGSTLPWVTLGAVIEQYTLSSLQTPSSCCNPYLALFSTPNWRAVSLTLSPVTQFSAQEPPSGQLSITIISKTPKQILSFLGR